MQRTKGQWMLLGGLVIVIVWLFLLVRLVQKDDSDPLQTTNLTGVTLTGSLSNTTTGSNSTGNQQIQTKTRSLHIALPHVLMSPGLQELAEVLQETKDIEVSFITGSNDQSYYDFVQEKLEKKEIDIALISSDVSVSFLHLAYTLETKEPLQGFFHFVFGQYFKGKTTQFIPYALEPLGIIGARDRQANENIITQYQDDQFFFGYDEATLRLLQAKQQPYSNYFLSIYRLVKNRYETNNPSEFKRFIDKQQDSKRSLVSLRKLTKDHSICQVNPHLCLLKQSPQTSMMGSLMDFALLNKYFPSLNTETLILYPFPSRQQPIKGRGRIINRQSQELVACLEFISEYLVTGTQNNNRLLPATLLSAFNNIYDQQIHQTRYQHIKKTGQQFALLYGSLERQDFYVNKSPILDVLKGTFNIELYMNQPGWEYK